MQKWSDRPPSEDAIDVLLKTSPVFLRAYGSLLTKILPPLSGFGIFLLYFYRNHFYPSFDLFQFSSLLLAAACIGFAIVGGVVFTMVAPGAALFHWFLNTKKVKEEVVYAMRYSEGARTKAVRQLVMLAYFGPFSLVGLGMVTAILLEPSLFTMTVLLWPILVALGFGIALQIRLDLPPWSFFHYGWSSYIALMIFVVLLSTILQSSLPIIDKLNNSWHYPILWAIPLVIAIMVSICSMAHFASWSAAIYFGLFFGLLLAGYSGLLTTVPEKTIKSLGLGAYDAEMIILDPVFCHRDLSELGIAEDCTLRNVHVVWSFGEAIVLRPALNEPYQIQIPTTFVRSLVQSTGPSPQSQ
ncbi:hypothetical protein [Pseudomonas sp. MYb185]|uniref:hypothetical protein n=1 Tax=Pseudomonas sp. MYb185 TaxID=1848729 RepID=UPI000CFC7827|nr:hypothetical protein [Pseudomonas sp. MYb185]PRB82731.1 hypothetical protein CQ007_05370 [Pseudomonas sp. MYb185]